MKALVNKPLMGMVMVLSLTGVAAAKPTPVGSLNQVQDLNPAAVQNDTGINRSGALLERSYFQAPQQRFNVSCRLQLSVFDKTHLTESCY
jgi:hypothetical protein